MFAKKFAKKKDRGINGRLDELGRAVVRASAINETEAEAASSSPFLYARLRARIAAERERREAGESWLTMLGVFWRAVPAMALMAVFALALFWSSASGTQSSGNFIAETLLDGEAGIEQVVFDDRQSLSSDEVLASILNEDEREATR